MSPLSKLQLTGSDIQVVLLVAPNETVDLQPWVDTLTQETVVGVLTLNILDSDMTALMSVVTHWLPDLLVVFDQDGAVQHTEQQPTVPQVIESLMALQLAFKPVLVVVSEADEATRIGYLTTGVDDVLPADMSTHESCVRLLVQLRKNIARVANPSTQLPGLSLIQRLWQRRHQQGQPWALLMMTLDHFDTYQALYGELPSQQVLRSLAAMLTTVLRIPDVVCHSDHHAFYILTHPEKAEKIAGILCRQFENAAPNFYSEKDRKLGYMTALMEKQVGRRTPLLSISVGIVDSRTQPYDSFLQVHNDLTYQLNAARLQPGNHWASNRLKLTGEQALLAQAIPHVLVVESDAAMAYLLKTTLEMEGYQVSLSSNAADAVPLLSEFPFDVVVLDALLQGDSPNRAQNEPSGLVFCRAIKASHPKTKVVCTSSLDERQAVLNAGADLYLPKPFDLVSLFVWIRRLLG